MQLLGNTLEIVIWRQHIYIASKMIRDLSIFLVAVIHFFIYFLVKLKLEYRAPIRREHFTSKTTRVWPMWNF